MGISTPHGARLCARRTRRRQFRSPRNRLPPSSRDVLVDSRRLAASWGQKVDYVTRKLNRRPRTHLGALRMMTTTERRTRRENNNKKKDNNNKKKKKKKK